MNNIFWLLFFEFFKTGLFSVGGGLATLPFLFKMSDKYGWFTTQQLTNMIAVSESTPGPIGINIATYAGFTTHNLGVPGAIFATLSLVAPSIIIILIIAAFLEKFSENRLVNNAFYGLRAAVGGLIASAFLTVVKTTFLIPGAAGIISMIDWKKVILFAALLFFVLKVKKHPIFYIAAGAAAGIVFAL